MGDNDESLRRVASVWGLGELPLAPGTWASGAAAAVYVVASLLPAPFSGWAMGLLLLGAWGLGLGVGMDAERLYGRTDPPQFVLDEVAGMWLVCVLLPWKSLLITTLFAFVAFRVFDVAKPWPLRRLEGLRGGWGIMADDFGAAVYSVLALVFLYKCVVD